uniref:CAZy families GT73 protein n=1 Tax=uncultured Agrobacterium sp. TaxID=157277 RepID=A0A060BPD7_9HYPH|nr:CAZy families GT73 protein [uncultured Agrobacterium sp.]
MLGVDLASASAPRFYEREGAVAYSGVATAAERILAHIALAKSVAERRGQGLVNHSGVSALTSIGLDYVPLSSNPV